MTRTVPQPLDPAWTGIRIPQVFRFRYSDDADWEYGLLSPVRESAAQWRGTWSRRGEAFSLQLRPELLPGFLKEPKHFEWLTHDYEWSRGTSVIAPALRTSKGLL